MKKILDFCKSNMIVIRWTAEYFFALWLILRFIFNFDMFNTHYWWKFFHATLHGFGGFVFGALIYSAIPIYTATTIIIYRKKEMIIKIPLADKAFEYISKLFPKKVKEEKTEDIEPKEETPTTNEPEIPNEVPPELRIPYARVKRSLSLTGPVSVYNQQKKQTPQTPESIMENSQNESPIPIPTDFDISESMDTSTESFPMFHDITFDEPEPEPEKLENATTKYFTEKNIEFETYKQFVATEKYVIYEHNDEDFWIMDDNVWFAAGKQIDSPVTELLDLAKQNNLTPVIYLKSQNIMDTESVIETFEKSGIRVVTKLDDLV